MISLRDFQSSDVATLLQGLNDLEVTRYLSDRLPSPYTIDDAIWWVDGGYGRTQYAQAIEYQNVCIGSVGVYLPSSDGDKQAEIGYWLLPEYWGQGIAAQAVKLMCRLVFAKYNISQIVNPVTKANVRSIKVMEKAGFEYQTCRTISTNGSGVKIIEHIYSLKRRGD